MLFASVVLYVLKTLHTNRELVLAAAGLLFIGGLVQVVREDYPKWRQIRVALRATS
jgi:hypothetical protein